jgi:hypothetical protein
VSTWFAQRVIDLLGRLRDLYYTRKYGEMARQLGRTGLASRPDRPGFIILQVDGLSHETLIQAVAAGAMPYTARLLGERKLVVDSWRCGLPSTTPAFQAGLLFGNRFDIPGFRWYNKEQRLPMLVRRPDQARVIRAAISDGHPGLLRGGSCYVSIFDGDADLALFTLSTLHSQRFFESARGFGLFLLFLLSPFRVLRLLWTMASSYMTRLGRRVAAVVQPSVVHPFDVLSPLFFTAGDVLFTAVQTFGVTLDIYRSVRSIYANYTTYDEVAHKVGASHPAAFRALREFDRSLRQIDGMRARYRRREYDLYLVSDHGNTPSLPFSWLHHTTLGGFISSELGEGVALKELLEGHPEAGEKTRYLLDEIRVLERRLSPRLRRVSAAARLYVRRRIPPPGPPDYDLSRQGDVVVSASGPLAHVYFNVAPRPLDLIEVLLIYPQLLDALLSTRGIGAVAGRAEDRTVLLGPDGGVSTIGPERRTVESHHPLAPYGDVAYAEDQVHLLLHYPHAGDLVVLGGVEPDGRVVTFEKQVSTHGGLGGSQMQPFIAWPPECQMVTSTLNRPEDLHRYFASRYLGERDGPPVEAPAAGGEAAGLAVRTGQPLATGR